MLSEIEGEFHTKTWFLFDVAFNGICCAFGIVGNSISLVVLRQLKDHKSTVYLLATLAVTDILFLIYITVSRVIPGACLAAGYPQCYISINRGFWISWSLGCMAQTAGTWIIVAITCDRYLAVCFPLKAIAWNMPKKIKRVIVGIILAAVFFNIPRFFDELDMEPQAVSINGTEQNEHGVTALMATDVTPTAVTTTDVNLREHVSDGNTTTVENEKRLSEMIVNIDLQKNCMRVLKSKVVKREVHH